MRSRRDSGTGPRDDGFLTGGNFQIREWIQAAARANGSMHSITPTSSSGSGGEYLKFLDPSPEHSIRASAVVAEVDLLDDGEIVSVVRLRTRGGAWTVRGWCCRERAMQLARLAGIRLTNVLNNEPDFRSARRESWPGPHFPASRAPSRPGGAGIDNRVDSAPRLNRPRLRESRVADAISGRSMAMRCVFPNAESAKRNARSATSAQPWPADGKFAATHPPAGFT